LGSAASATMAARRKIPASAAAQHVVLPMQRASALLPIVCCACFFEMNAILKHGGCQIAVLSRRAGLASISSAQEPGSALQQSTGKSAELIAPASAAWLQSPIYEKRRRAVATRRR